MRDPREKADESLTADDVLKECEVTIPSWARHQAGIPEKAKLACYVRDGVIYVGEADDDEPDIRDVPYYVLEFFAENNLSLRALEGMLDVWVSPIPALEDDDAE